MLLYMMKIFVAIHVSRIALTTFFGMFLNTTKQWKRYGFSLLHSISQVAITYPLAIGNRNLELTDPTYNFFGILSQTMFITYVIIDFVMNRISAALSFHHILNLSASTVALYKGVPHGVIVYTSLAETSTVFYNLRGLHKYSKQTSLLFKVSFLLCRIFGGLFMLFYLPLYSVFAPFLYGNLVLNCYWVFFSLKRRISVHEIFESICLHKIKSNQNKKHHGNLK